MHKLLISAAAAALAALAATAHAEVVDLTFGASDGTGVSAQLQLTTTGVDNGYGAQDVTDITGLVTGGVAPGAVTSFTPTPGLTGYVISADGKWYYDNWYYDSPATTGQNLYAHGHVDNAGLLFDVGAAEYNLFWDVNAPGGYQLEVYDPATDSFSGNSFGDIAGVPEPSTWVLTLMGLTALGGVLRARRSRRLAAA